MFGWSTDQLDGLSTATSLFFSASSHAAAVLGTWRVLACWYTIGLMLRFFFSFGSQPRLAVVTRTMTAAVVDLLHFLVVLAPVLLAYVICGNLLFGRSMEEFATVAGSAATVLRIASESEYMWREMARENFWTAGIFIWSLCCLVIVLMLNMLVAVVLDVYGEVRNASRGSEAIWDTLYAFLCRAIYLRSWVPCQNLDEKLASSETGSLLSRDDLIRLYPSIPGRQVELLFASARKCAESEALRIVGGKALLQLMASMMQQVSNLKDNVAEMQKDGQENLVKRWSAFEPGMDFPDIAEVNCFTLSAGARFSGSSSSSFTLGNDVVKPAASCNSASAAWLRSQRWHQELGSSQPTAPIADFIQSPDAPVYMSQVAVLLEKRRRYLSKLKEQVSNMQIILQEELQKVNCGADKASSGRAGSIL